MKSPPSLYDICVKIAVKDCVTVCKFCKKEFRSLPNNVLFDFYYTMYLEKRSCLLTVEFSELEVFTRMLTVKHKRVQLLKSFQGLINHGSNVPDELIQDFSKRIFAETIYCEFKAAENTFNSAKKVIKQLEELNAVPNLAGLYANFSTLYFHRSEYDEAFSWSKKALVLLDDKVPPRIVIEVLRQASRACVVKRRFNQAGLLIRQAVNLASEIYEIDGHPHFSDTLLDYGFYLLNFDSIQESVKVYERSLQIRMDVFEKNNIHLALAHEDMAYALYVNEYSSGRFYAARENADRAIRLMERILPSDHLMLASAKRVKALILEEIALDMREGNNSHLQEKYLVEAEELHQTALALSYKAFGEKNVQTAKHYGNLGRLYQSMRQYEEAEKMHLKAIAIKEELLGSEDYEVGLSIGHLASLYNYHMKRHHDAEKLYMRSMEINLNLFGETYSGFEYDYRGLINVYSKLHDQSNVILYTLKMRDWSIRRSQTRPVVHVEEILPLKEIVEKFLGMC
ncbi:amyloid protein-binding protein 2 [Asbolus verrucosus]|uniref:Amyloid protein-binding protein 2 n=1 Tax=Asbolus verrucosus TaxID=1661398 RepID=A0A482W9A7_ASBVE|nr:amyloid protein-binding protein 2 [Asbolus verrucosus]